MPEGTKNVSSSNEIISRKIYFIFKLVLESTQGVHESTEFLSEKNWTSLGKNYFPMLAVAFISSFEKIAYYQFRF